MNALEIRGKPCHIRKEGNDSNVPPILRGMTVPEDIFDQKVCTEVFYYEDAPSIKNTSLDLDAAASVSTPNQITVVTHDACKDETTPLISQSSTDSIKSTNVCCAAVCDSFEVALNDARSFAAVNLSWERPQRHATSSRMTLWHVVTGVLGALMFCGNNLHRISDTHCRLYPSESKQESRLRRTICKYCTPMTPPPCTQITPVYLLEYKIIYA